LSLAGRGDVERIVTRITNSERRGKPALDTGPFGDSSLFAKVLDGTLTTQQAQKYAPFRDILRRGASVQVWPASPADIRAIRLSGAACTDDALAGVTRLVGLRLLALHGTRVTDAGFRRLKDLKNLQELWIKGTKVSDAALAELEQELPRLKVKR